MSSCWESRRDPGLLLLLLLLPGLSSAGFRAAESQPVKTINQEATSGIGLESSASLLLASGASGLSSLLSAGGGDGSSRLLRPRLIRDAVLSLLPPPNRPPSDSISTDDAAYRFYYPACRLTDALVNSTLACPLMQAFRRSKWGRRLGGIGEAAGNRCQPGLAMLMGGLP